MRGRSLLAPWLVLGCLVGCSSEHPSSRDISAASCLPGDASATNEGFGKDASADASADVVSPDATVPRDASFGPGVDAQMLAVDAAQSDAALTDASVAPEEPLWPELNMLFLGTTPERDTDSHDIPIAQGSRMRADFELDDFVVPGIYDVSVRVTGEGFTGWIADAGAASSSAEFLVSDDDVANAISHAKGFIIEAPTEVGSHAKVQFVVRRRGSRAVALQYLEFYAVQPSAPP